MTVDVYAVGSEEFSEGRLYQHTFWSFDPEKVHAHIREECMVHPFDCSDEDNRDVEAGEWSPTIYWVECFKVEFEREAEMYSTIHDLLHE